MDLTIKSLVKEIKADNRLFIKALYNHMRPEFMAWFSQLHWDIAIAPLKDTPFNRGKSDIKFLDYCALGAAGIYSNLPVYESSIRHLETGWLADNTLESWVEALESLLLDNQLRERIAQNAAQYLLTHRTVGCCVHNWLAALENLLGES